jgi:hypothetical protein
MPQNKGAPRAAKINVTLAIGVPNVGAFTLVNEQRSAADSPKCPYRRVDPSRKPQAGFFEKRSAG